MGAETFAEFERLEKAGLRSEVIIALIIAAKLGGLRSGNKKVGTIEEMSACVAKAIDKYGIRTGLALTVTPKGYYSESIETFVGCFTHFNYAVRRSPFELTEEGIKSCERLVKEGLLENPEMTKRLAKIFGLSENNLITAVE